jgi:hypothetical protein
MRDHPLGTELLTAFAEFNRSQVMPALPAGPLAYYARVADNVLNIARREIALGPAADAAEIESLRSLLGTTGDLPTLNRELCWRIADGAIRLDDSRLIRHLWQVTLDKLAIDQPTYSAYRRALEKR